MRKYFSFLVRELLLDFSIPVAVTLYGFFIWKKSGYELLELFFDTLFWVVLIRTACWLLPRIYRIQKRS